MGASNHLLGFTWNFKMCTMIVSPGPSLLLNWNAGDVFLVTSQELEVHQLRLGL